MFEPIKPVDIEVQDSKIILLTGISVNGELEGVGMETSAVDPNAP